MTFDTWQSLIEQGLAPLGSESFWHYILTHSVNHASSEHTYIATVHEILGRIGAVLGDEFCDCTGTEGQNQCAR